MKHALKIILLFKLKIIIGLQNEGYTNKWQRSNLEKGSMPLSRGEELNTIEIFNETANAYNHIIAS